MQKVRLLVSGRVQGVGFRYSTYALALDIGEIYGGFLLISHPKIAVI